MFYCRFLWCVINNDDDDDDYYKRHKLRLMKDADVGKVPLCSSRDAPIRMHYDASETVRVIT